MKFTCGLTLTLPLVLVLLLVVATKGHTVLQCYVCDNCEKVNNKLTPLEQCGGEHFSTTTTVASTSMSPTGSTTTTTSSSVNENVSTTTVMPAKDSTARPSTEDPETTNSTIELITLSTNSLTSSTTPSTIVSTNATSSTSTSTPAVFVTPTEESSTTPSTTTTTVSSAESDLVIPSGNITWAFPSGNLSEVSINRQRRHTEFNGITYYCYKIQKRYDNVFGTKRGCIGVKTNERPVCDELNMANNNQTKKCSACTTTMCNGSSTLGVSIATLLVALLALIYKV